MRRSKRKSKSGFMYLMGLLILCCLTVIGMKEYDIYQIRQEQNATEQRIAALKKEKAQLEAERKRLDDPRYIEKLAREDYNMVGKNEVPLFIVDEQKDKK